MEPFDEKILYKKCCLNYLPVGQASETKPNIGQNLWVLDENTYGLWVIADLWVMGRNFPQTDLVDKIFYGV